MRGFGRREKKNALIPTIKMKNALHLRVKVGLGGGGGGGD